MQKQLGSPNWFNSVTELGGRETNWIKYYFSAILKRHCCHSNELLTLFDALKVILCVALVSFFSEIFMGSF